MLPASIGAKRIADLIVRPSAIGFLSANDRRLQLNEELEQLGMRMGKLPKFTQRHLLKREISYRSQRTRISS